jgi:hypothetical protein
VVVLFFLVALIAIGVLVVAVGLLTRKPPYECPPGQSIVATVRRHGDAAPRLVVLEAAGIKHAGRRGAGEIALASPSVPSLHGLPCP